MTWTVRETASKTYEIVRDLDGTVVFHHQTVQAAEEHLANLKEIAAAQAQTCPTCGQKMPTGVAKKMKMTGSMPGGST